MARTGRPTTYTKAIALKICEQIAQGKSVRKICLQKNMPSMASVFNWLAKHEEFLEQYALAKEQSSAVDEETLAEIGDMAIAAVEKVSPKRSSAVVQAYKLKADNLKWAMSKKNPKKYSDRMTHAGDKDNPIAIEGVSISVRKK